MNWLRSLLIDIVVRNIERKYEKTNSSKVDPFFEELLAERPMTDDELDKMNGSYYERTMDRVNRPSQP
jgi:hypothetical protein